MKNLLFLLIPFLVIMSCQKENVYDDNSSSYQDNSELTSSYNRFGKTLAKAVENESALKKLLIQEAEKKFNGDYDVLYATFKDLKIKDRYVYEVLAKYDSEQSLNTRSSADYNVVDFYKNQLIQIDPYVTVYIPEVHFHRPGLFDLPAKVAIVDENVDEKTTEYLNGYNENGVEVQIDSRDYPNEQSVFVIKHNERILIVSPNTRTTYFGRKVETEILKRFPPDFPDTEEELCEELWISIEELEEDIEVNGQSHKVVLLETLYRIYNDLCVQDPDDPTGGGDDPCIEPCERDCRIAKDEVYQVKFISYTAFKEGCSWWDGDLELYMILTYGQTDPAGNMSGRVLEKWETSEREDWFEDCNWFNGSCSDPLWKTKNWETFTWDARQRHTWDKEFEWWEEDGKDLAGSSITVGATFSFNTDTLKILGKPLKLNFPVSITLKYNPKDDKYGDSVSEYCDKAFSPGETYNTGSLKFKYRRR